MMDNSARQSIEALFHPSRIAVVGASPNPGFAHSIHRLLIKGGFEGEIFAVNPRYSEVLGSPCYPSIDAIPGGVDKAIIIVPSHHVLNALEQAERAGAKAVNIIASGFGEQDDEAARERQRAVREFAERTGIRAVGPNCLGIVSTRAKMIAISGPYQAFNRGPIGLVMQSGLLAYSTTLPPMDRGFGFSYVVTTGNEADLEAADFIRYMVEDDETRVIGCFIEQFRNPEKLIEAAELAAERKKPIVVLKIGRSEGAKRAARAHTGSLVGSFEIVDAVMRRLGIVRVNNLDEMIETLAIFHTTKLPQGPGVGTIFVSGGAGGLVSDLAESIGVTLPPLAPETAEKLAAVIPPYGTVGNPLDTTGQVGQQPEILEGSLIAMGEDPNIHTVIYGQAFPTRVDLATPAGEVIRSTPVRFPDKVFLIASLVTGKIQPGGRYDIDPVEPTTEIGGVPFLQGMENTLRAVKSMNDYAEFLRNRNALPKHQAAPSDVADYAREIVLAAGGKPLVERAAKSVLSLYGIPITQESLATTPEDAVEAARAIGYPVVLKIESPDIAHKTEAGGVLLNIGDDGAVRSGFASIMSRARNYAPQAELAGVLVQEMVPKGQEIIVGMTQDPAFGPAIAVGLGGVLVEVLRDIQIGVPPLSEYDLRGMIARLRGAAILEGVRGAAPSDVDALVDVLARFSQLCLDLRDVVSEIDINPLVVFERGKGARVVDCLIVPKAGTGA
ncbi:MAG: hypothetical protein DCC58_11055 [Chloroflexi bacterium]|nr:MAG: hypothetical protein DCC58_11055 [Chloroflexota bacterium]